MFSAVKHRERVCENVIRCPELGSCLRRARGRALGRGDDDGGGGGGEKLVSVQQDNTCWPDTLDLQCAET